MSQVHHLSSLLLVAEILIDLEIRAIIVFLTKVDHIRHHHFDLHTYNQMCLLVMNMEHLKLTTD